MLSFILSFFFRVFSLIIPCRAYICVSVSVSISLSLFFFLSVFLSCRSLSLYFSLSLLLCVWLALASFRPLYSIYVPTGARACICFLFLGHLRDVTGSYHASFHLMSSCGLFSAFVMIVTSLVSKTQARCARSRPHEPLEGQKSSKL